jgi:hypothetical protein
MAIAPRIAVACALVAALASLPLPASAQDQEQDTIALVGIDTHAPSDPRADLSDAPQTCLRLDDGDTAEIAVFTSAVPDSRGISGFEFRLTFDPDLVTVSAVDPDLLLAQAEGSDVLPVGDTESEDGELLAGVADFGALGIEPEGASETGPGLLLGLTLSGGSASGLADLTINGVIITDDANAVIPVDATTNAQVAANQDCPGAPSATPEPSGEDDGGAGSTLLVVLIAVLVLLSVAGAALAYRYWLRRRRP